MKKLFFINFVISSALTAAFYFFSRFYPIQYVYAVAEDGWTEYATFVFYFTSAILLFALCWGKKEFRKSGHIALFFLTFVFAFEEISWGQRILNISTPAWIAAVNSQEELTFHNLYGLESAWRYVKDCIFGWVFLAPFVFWLWKKADSVRKHFGIPLVPIFLWPFFMATYFLHEDFISIYNSQEPFEVFLSFSFFIFILWIFMRQQEFFQTSKEYRRFVVFISNAVAITTILLILFFPSSTREIRENLKDAVAWYEGRGLIRQASEISAHVHKRFATEQEFGEGML